MEDDGPVGEFWQEIADLITKAMLKHQNEAAEKMFGKHASHLRLVE